MSAGFPLSAVIGKRAIMDAWEPAHGESIHTSTHLGNPMGCAAALAAINLTRELHLPERAASLELVVERELAVLKDHAHVVDVRGRGLLWGIEFADPAVAAEVVARALSLGLILLQSGLRGEVVAISPPLVISEALLIHALSRITTIVDNVTVPA
jgi:4-aminobutyrate aminotransferase-like enzyme